MAKLIWADRAASDLERIYDFIAVDSPLYARTQVQRVLRAAERLQRPGRILPELPHFPHRELIIGSYRLIHRYENKSDTIFIVTIVHSARVLPESLLA